MAGDPSLEQSYRFGFHRFWSVLLEAGVLVGLATVAGLILFVIPGIYIGVRLAVSIEALVVEGRRGTQAMGQSLGVGGGHWWHAFGTLLVAWLVIGVVNSVITLPFGDTGWFVQGLVAAVATVVTLPYQGAGRGAVVSGSAGSQGGPDAGGPAADLQASAV